MLNPVCSADPFVGHLDVVHACQPRALPERPLEALERLGLPFGEDVHAAVGAVADPAVQPFECCPIGHEHPKADALDPAGDEITTSQTHARAEIIACGLARPLWRRPDRFHSCC